MEERKAQIEELTTELRNVRRLHQDGREEMERLRGELEEARRAVERAIEKSAVQRPIAGPVGGDDDGGAVAGVAMMAMAQAAAAVAIPAVLCVVM